MLPQLIDALSSLFLLLLTFLGLKLREYLQQRIKNELLQNATVRLSEAALLAIKSVEQTFTADLRKASEDGKLSEGERQIALTRAVENAKRVLGEQGREVLSKTYGEGERELERLLKVEIEARLHNLKKKGEI